MSKLQRARAMRVLIAYRPNKSYKKIMKDQGYNAILEEELKKKNGHSKRRIPVNIRNF